MSELGLSTTTITLTDFQRNNNCAQRVSSFNRVPLSQWVLLKLFPNVIGQLFQDVALFIPSQIVFGTVGV